MNQCQTTDDLGLLEPMKICGNGPTQGKMEEEVEKERKRVGGEGGRERNRRYHHSLNPERIITGVVQSCLVAGVPCSSRALCGRCNMWTLEAVVLSWRFGGDGFSKSRRRAQSAPVRCLPSAFLWRCSGGFKPREERIPTSAEITSALLSPPFRPAALLHSC